MKKKDKEAHCDVIFDYLKDIIIAIRDVEEKIKVVKSRLSAIGKIIAEIRRR